MLSSKSTYKKKISYDVVFTGNGITGWECNCPSGYYTWACSHRAQVLQRLQREPHLFDPPPPPPKPLAPQPRVFREPRPETRVWTPAIQKSVELREQARQTVEHSARLKAQAEGRREAQAGVARDARRVP